MAGGQETQPKKRNTPKPTQGQPATQTTKQTQPDKPSKSEQKQKNVSIAPNATLKEPVSRQIIRAVMTLVIFFTLHFFFSTYVLNPYLRGDFSISPGIQVLSSEPEPRDAWKKLTV